MLYVEWLAFLTARRSIAIMTTISGKYMFCDTDGRFLLTMTYTGQNCSSFFGRNNLITCTQSDRDSWKCQNGVICSGAATFLSSLSIAQSNQTILQTQNTSINGTNFVFGQGGTGNATIRNGTTTSTGPVTTATTTSATTAINSSSPASSSSRGASGCSRHSYSASLTPIRFC